MHGSRACLLARSCWGTCPQGMHRSAISENSCRNRMFFKVVLMVLFLQFVVLFVPFFQRCHMFLCFFCFCNVRVFFFCYLVIFGLSRRFPDEKSKTNAKITNISLNKTCWEGLCGSHRFEVLVPDSGVYCCQSHEGRESLRGWGGCF